MQKPLLRHAGWHPGGTIMVQRLPVLLLLVLVIGCTRSDAATTRAEFAFLPIYPGGTEVAYFPPPKNTRDPQVIYTAPAGFIAVRQFYVDALTSAGWRRDYSPEPGKYTFTKETTPPPAYTYAAYNLEIFYEEVGPTETRVSFRQFLSVGHIYR